jgi:Sigma-70, region 4/Bacterial RNA polymerase, alpha chain C terminal domain
MLSLRVCITLASDKEGTMVSSSDPVVDDRLAACWLDSFPWVEAAQGESADADAWWQEPIDAAGSDQRAERTLRLAELALERLGRWTIGQIFPGMDAALPLSLLDLGARAQNGLTRSGAHLAGDVFGWTLDELLDMRNFGLGTVVGILQAFADASTDRATPVLLPGQAGSGRHRAAGERHDDELVSWGESFIGDLRLLASWYAALGTPATALLETEPRPGTPPEVIKARQRLLLISAADVLDEHEVTLDAASLLAQCVGALDERAQQILARRFFADDPETLDELGTSLGVTRERVRQIEGKARANMVGFLEPGGALELVSASVREFVESVLPLHDLLELVPALAREVEAVGQPAWRVLDRLDDQYEIEDDWCVAPSMVAAQTVTLSRLQELANQYGVVRIDELEPINRHMIDPDQAQRRWLEYCGYVLHGEHVFIRTQSVGDRAAAVLSVEGAALGSQTILDRLGVDRTLGSLKNAMSSDERFERVDRDQWALAEWGMESYVGVRGLIKQEVTQAGGRIGLESLIQKITGRYSVTASSVVAYASAAPFEVRDGEVRVATKDRDVRKTPTRTRRLYRRDGAWLYRVQVTKEHLRGSGSVAPVALAGVLELQYGESRQLESPQGPQLISWVGNQPTFGTIRRFLAAADVAIGAEIFLVLVDGGGFNVEVVPSPVTVSPIQKAMALAGVADWVDTADARAALASAIDLPVEATINSVIGAYRDRGDEDIADLLLDAKENLLDPESGPVVPTAGINEILDLL